MHLLNMSSFSPLNQKKAAEMFISETKHSRDPEMPKKKNVDSWGISCADYDYVTLLWYKTCRELCESKGENPKNLGL